MSDNKKSSYVNLGVMVRDKEKDSKGKDKYYLLLDKNVEISINGVPYKKKSINISRLTDKYDRMLESGKLSKEEYDEKVAQFTGKGKYNYMQFEFVAKLD